MAIGTFISSMMGMNAQSHALGQIGTNIANVNTTAYKKTETLFQTTLAHSTNYGSNSLAGAQKFFSVGPVDRRLVDVNGMLKSTYLVNDLALDGQGFFAMQSYPKRDDSVYYSRAGDFRQTAIAPPDAAGSNINKNSGTAGTSGSTGTYLVNGAGYYVLGWNVDRDTLKFPSATQANMQPLRVDPELYINGKPTTEIKLRANISSDRNADIPTQKISLPVYDSEGNSHTVSMIFDPSNSINGWYLDFYSADGTVTSPTPQQYEAIFNGNAALETPRDPITVNIDWNNGQSGSFTLDLTGMTQYADELIFYGADQDGAPTGQLVDTSWDKNGILYGNYSNNVSVPICKLAIANVRAPNSMEALSGNMFAWTEAAGDLEYVDLSDKDMYYCNVVSGSLEMSNVVLEDEFTNMIKTQRAYTSSTNVFKTNDEMLQSAIALKS